MILTTIFQCNNEERAFMCEPKQLDVRPTLLCSMIDDKQFGSVGPTTKQYRHTGLMYCKHMPNAHFIVHS